MYTPNGVWATISRRKRCQRKKTKLLKSLRFRILIILVILGIVPSVIVANVIMVAAYEIRQFQLCARTVENSVTFCATC